MTLYQPAYRLTLYGPRSLDATEATVLTPAAGGDHSDNFKVTTLPALSGFKPYMHEAPKGRATRMDPLTRTADVGTFEVTLLDKANATTSNLSRWVTTFLGNTAGANQLNGLKGYIEESLDNGANWSAWQTGRIVSTSLDDRKPGTLFVLRFRDMGADLNTNVFVGRPHASATGPGPMQIIPVGLAAAWGDFDVQPLLSGTVGASTASTGKVITLSSSSQSSIRNVMDESLRQEGVTFNNPVNPHYVDTVRVYIVRGDTGATGELRLGEVETVAGGALGGFGSAVKVTKKIVDALPVLGEAAVTSITRSGAVATVTTAAAHNIESGTIVTHAGANQTEYNVAAVITKTAATTYTYAVAGTPATPATGTIYASQYKNFIPLPPNGTAVTFGIRRVASPPDEGTPLFIDDVNRITFISDLLAGYYGYLNLDGSVKRSYATHAASFSTLAADTSIPLFRGRIKKKMKLYEVLAAVCLEGGLGYFINGAGEVQLFDMRFPNAVVTAGTIADSDVVGEPHWEQPREEAISTLTTLYYHDVEEAISSTYAPPVGGAIGWLGVNTTAIKEVQKKVIDYEYGNQDTGGNEVTIDAIGFRQADGETVTSGTNGTLDRESYVYGLAASVGVELRKPFGNGPQRVTMTVRRTAVVTALTVGSWVLSAVSKIPDAATNERGGTRLYRVLEITPHGLTVDLVLLDSGPNVIAAVPTVGTLAAGTDSAHQVKVPITRNAAADPVILRIATTDTSTGTIPTDASGAWTVVTPDGLSGPRILHDGDYTVSNCPSGQRVWVEARSEPPPSVDAKLPSGWAVSSGTDYRDTTGLTAPNTVANADNTPADTDTLTLTWVNGSASTPIEIQLVYVSGAGSSVTTIPILPAGSTSYILNDWVTANTTYTPRVRHVDLLGGVSSWANASGDLVVGGSFTGPTLSVGTIALTEYA